jgi:hypothetical protein
MPYITKSNSNRIIKKIKLNDIPEFQGEVYKKPIYFLSKEEVKYLLLMQTLLKEPEKFAIEVYQPIFNKDTFQFVFESEQKPSYHLNKNCERLNSKFKNFQIPNEIKERIEVAMKIQGHSDEEIKQKVIEQIEAFRKWFKQNIELFQNDTKEFIKKLDIRWNVQRKLQEIDYDNSGTDEIENLNLNDIENQIDQLLREAGRYFNSNPSKQELIRRFQKFTFLAYKEEKIYGNETELTDDELKKFLKDYDEQFKKPVKKLLIDYYRIKYNPELSFEGQLLERLNFRQCSVCSGSDLNNYVISESFEKDIPFYDDLPF